jgi:hypothetical protein
MPDVSVRVVERSKHAHVGFHWPNEWRIPVKGDEVALHLYEDVVDVEATSHRPLLRPQGGHFHIVGRVESVCFSRDGYQQFIAIYVKQY